MFNFAGYLMPFLMHGEELFGDASSVFNAVAHGEGGVAKVTATVGALEHLLGHAKAALAAVQAPPAPVAQPVIAETPAVAETPDVAQDGDNPPA